MKCNYDFKWKAIIRTIQFNLRVLCPHGRYIFIIKSRAYWIGQFHCHLAITRPFAVPLSIPLSQLFCILQCINRFRMSRFFLFIQFAACSTCQTRGQKEWRKLVLRIKCCRSTNRNESSSILLWPFYIFAAVIVNVSTIAYNRMAKMCTF